MLRAGSEWPTDKYEVRDAPMRHHDEGNGKCGCLARSTVRTSKDVLTVSTYCKFGGTKRRTDGGTVGNILCDWRCGGRCTESGRTLSRSLRAKSHQPRRTRRGAFHPQGPFRTGFPLPGLIAFSSFSSLQGRQGRRGGRGGREGREEGCFADRDGRSDATGAVSRPAPISIYAACHSHDVRCR